MLPGPDGLVGRVIGGYRLNRLLGSGGTGAVFLGEREDSLPAGDAPPEQAAIKVLIPPMQLSANDQAEFRTRFRREAEALQQLRHPHILSVRALGEDEATGLPYMVLPYLDGGTLATRLAAGALALTEASQYFAQLADALDYAHGQMVVHRDIKPANILLDRQGQVYLADFGLVKLFDGTRTTLTTTGQVMGTPEYMAPEQARGDQVGPAADIYSAGIVLYQMVTGRLPFQAKSLTDMLLQIVQSAPPPPRQFRPDLPEPAEAAILRALAKSPAARLSSAGTLSRAFALGLQGQWSDDLRSPAVPADPTIQVVLPPTIATPPSATHRSIDSLSGTVPAAPPQPFSVPPLYVQQPAPANAWPGTPGQTAGGGWTGAPPTVGAAQQPGRRWNRVALYICTALIVLSLSGVGVYLHFQPSQTGSGGPGPNATATGGPGSTITPLIANQHFKIATDLPVSGPDASVGLPTQYAVDLAVSQNADLGNGNTLEVIHMNNEGVSGADPTIGAQNIQRLIADPQVVAIVGPFNSGVAKVEIPLVTTASLVEISPSNTNPGLTEQQYAQQYSLDFSTMHPSGYPEAYFRIPGPDDQQGKADAMAALGSPLNARTVYVVDDSSAYGKGLSDFFTQSFTASGGTVLGRQSISSQSSDLTPLASAITSAHPDVVFYGGVTSDGGGRLKKDLVADGYGGPMLGGDGIAEDPGWQQIAGAAASNTFGTVAAPDVSTLPAQFTNAYNAFVASKPDNQLWPYSAMAYDAAMVEISAIRSLLSSGTPITRANVRGVVAGIQYAGVTGQISFDANGDDTHSVFSLYGIDASEQWRYVRQIIV